MTPRQAITALTTSVVCLSAEVEALTISSRPEVSDALDQVNSAIIKLGNVAGTKLLKEDISKAVKAHNAAMKVLRG